MQELNQKWEDLRAQNCLPTVGRRSYEKVDMEAYKKEEDFMRFYDSGTFVPVKEFLAQKRIHMPYSTEEQCAKLIEEDP